MVRFVSAVLAQFIAALLTFVPCRFVAQTGATRDLKIDNGDLELAAVSGPPPGWTMWGPKCRKDPGNYTCESANPHGGIACLRIHLPALDSEDRGKNKGGCVVVREVEVRTPHG